MKKTIFNNNELTHQMLARRFHVTGTPTMIFIDSSGQPLGIQPGFIKADIFTKLLSYIGDDLFDELEFKEYRNQHEGSVN